MRINNILPHTLSIIVLLFTFQTQAQKAPINGPAADYLKALTQFEPYAESTWKDYPKIAGSGYFGDGVSGGNAGIRGNCGIALSYAVLVLEYPNAPERAHRLARVKAALTYAAMTHVSAPDSLVAVDGNRWGALPGTSTPGKRGWQSCLWAASMGFTAALLEKELDPQLIKECKRVIAAEADILATVPPPTGYIGDSKAEETGWDTSVPCLAAAWMPEDPRAKTWLETAKRYLINTYTVPADSLGPFKEWVTTQTLYPSYAMENHGFYHPSYQMVAGMSMGDSYLMMSMVNPALAKELQKFAEHNVKNVWQFVKGLMLETGEIAYPSGLDWSLHSFEHVSYLAWMATHFAEPEAQWLQPTMTKHILERQQINGDGRFVGESCPNGFYREAVEAVRIAAAYLHNKMAGFPTAKGTPLKEHFTHYADAGLIIQRTKTSLVTVSYGKKTMALVYPLNGKTLSQKFITSPNQNSLIAADGVTVLKDLKNDATSFRAELKLNGKRGRVSTMIVENRPEAVIFAEVPAASATLPPAGEWYLMAIENHALTGKKRQLYWSGDSTATVNERSGKIQPIKSNWVNIDNWMSFIAQPEGTLSYHAPEKYNRDGAAEDVVWFRPADLQKPRVVLVLPGASAETTQALAKSLTWNTTGTNAQLSFNGAKKKKVEVQIPLTK